MSLLVLNDRGVDRLMVEGGGVINTQFLTAGLADELHLVVAPFFVGDARAPRFALPARYPYTSEHPMTLLSVRRVGNVAVHHYRR